MGTMRLFTLAHDAARRGVAEFAQKAPEGTVVRFSEPKRGLDINAALHAMLGEIAESREHAGRKWDLEVWKRLLVAAWSRAIGEQVQYLPALDGQGIDIVWRRTSEMTQAEVRDLLGFVDAWRAETEPDQEKQA